MILLLLACAQPTPGDTGRAESWEAAVMSRIAADARAIAVEPGGFRATMPLIEGAAHFDGEGMSIQEGEEESLRLRFEGWGRAGALRAAPAVAPALGACVSDLRPNGECVRRLEYPWAGLDGWWVGLDAGVEFGWTLHEAPAGEGPVELVTRVEGATVEADEGDGSARLLDAAGRSWQVGSVSAWDAEGDPLSARLRVEGERLVVEVDDRGAVYPVTVDPVATTASTTVYGTATGGGFAVSVEDAGDVNNDGYGDVVVGDLNTAAGAIHVFHGSASGLATTAATSIAATGSETFGWAVDGAGDVNNDGYDDIIVGAYNAGTNATGRFYIFHGGPSGVSGPPARTVNGNGTYYYFGYSVAGAGDVNNDGYDDVIVGAYGAPNGGYTMAGQAYVYLGSASGIGASPARTLYGEDWWDSFGTSVAGIGDVNNDGYADVAVGAPGWETGSAIAAGRVYVYHGGGSGIGASATRVLQGGTQDSIGRSVDGAGDVNGDGYDDVIVSAHTAEISGVANTGRAHVYHGSSSGLPASATTTLTGGAPGVYFGRIVRGVGDLEGDGYADIAVGTTVADSYAGRVWVFRGSASGVNGTAASNLYGAATSYTGYGLGGGGDVNGDGRGDLLVASPYDKLGGVTLGALRVYVGAPDADGDGLAGTDDCDDTDPAIGGGSTWWLDADGDGVGTASSSVTACSAPSGYVSVAGDCDDGDALYQATSTWYADVDGDGYGDVASPAVSCGPDAGFVASSDDCDDGSAGVNPGAAEVCDGADNNCDGGVDEGVGTWSWSDVDQDGYGDPSSALLSCEVPAGNVFDASDCNDADDIVNPSAVEYCDGIDNNCDGAVDVGAVDEFGYFTDADGDGYGDPSLSGLGCELPVDGTFDGTDCDDLDAAVNPEAVEVCNGVDDDCDGSIDPATAADASTWYADLDGDGHGDVGAPAAACAVPFAYVASADDCDDLAATTHPGAAEVCNHVDDDCDTVTDEAGATGEVSFFVDADADGFGESGVTQLACWEGGGLVALDGDCDDTDGAVHPGAPETCNDIDDDCDDVVDPPTSEDALLSYRDADGDGFGITRRAVLSCDVPAGYVLDAGDCRPADGASYPGAAERCDGLDNSCDGTVDEPGSALEPDWYTDADGDGFGAGLAQHACTAPSGTVAENDDCNDGAATVNPGAMEACNGVDDDCDTSVDEAGALGESSWYVDADGDGYGGPNAVLACDPVPGRIATGADCDDASSAAYPGAPERCDGEQNNCSLAWTPDSEDGTVWLENAGAWTDQTSSWAAGTAGSPAAVSVPANGTLWVCDGTWYVRLTAGAPGTLTVASQNGLGAVTLDGGAAGSVVNVSNSSVNLLLDGLVLTNGSGSGSPTRGGALRVSAGTVTVDNCELEGNTASNGGAVAVLGGTVSLLDSAVRSNTASSGGGLYQSGGTLGLSNVTVEANSAANGGGYYHSSGTFSAADSDFLSNVATTSGGGIRAGNSMSLGTCTFDGNSAQNGGGVYYGGAGGTLTLTDTLFTDNTASAYGGGVYQAAGRLTCTASSAGVSAGFLLNSATTGGGGVHLPTRTTTLTSTLCDWGASAPENNSPQDIRYQAASYNRGNDMSFTCQNGTCN